VQKPLRLLALSILISNVASSKQKPLHMKTMLPLAVKRVVAMLASFARKEKITSCRMAM